MGGKLWTQSYFVESTGYANEDVIRAYVQNQLKVMNDKEASTHQFGCFETRSLAAELFIAVKNNFSVGKMAEPLVFEK